MNVAVSGSGAYSNVPVSIRSQNRGNVLIAAPSAKGAMRFTSDFKFFLSTPKFLQTRLTAKVFHHITSYIMLKLFIPVLPPCSCSRKNAPGLDNDAIHNVSVSERACLDCIRKCFPGTYVAHRLLDQSCKLQRYATDIFVIKVSNVTVYVGQLLRHISRHTTKVDLGSVYVLYPNQDVGLQQAGDEPILQTAVVLQVSFVWLRFPACSSQKRLLLVPAFNHLIMNLK